MMEDRKITLLRACYALLEKCDKAGYVISAMETSVFYDGAECDGFCLMEDIKAELEQVRQ